MTIFMSANSGDMCLAASKSILKIKLKVDLAKRSTPEQTEIPHDVITSYFVIYEFHMINVYIQWKQRYNKNNNNIFISKIFTDHQYNMKYGLFNNNIAHEHCPEMRVNNVKLYIQYF